MSWQGTRHPVHDASHQGAVHRLEFPVVLRNLPHGLQPQIPPRPLRAPRRGLLDRHRRRPQLGATETLERARTHRALLRLLRKAPADGLATLSASFGTLLGTAPMTTLFAARGRPTSLGRANDHQRTQTSSRRRVHGAGGGKTRKADASRGPTSRGGSRPSDRDARTTTPGRRGRSTGSSGQRPDSSRPSEAHPTTARKQNRRRKAIMVPRARRRGRPARRSEARLARDCPARASPRRRGRRRGQAAQSASRGHRRHADALPKKRHRDSTRPSSRAKETGCRGRGKRAAPDRRAAPSPPSSLPHTLPAPRPLAGALPRARRRRPRAAGSGPRDARPIWGAGARSFLPLSRESQPLG